MSYRDPCRASYAYFVHLPDGQEVVLHVEPCQRQRHDWEGEKDAHIFAPVLLQGHSIVPASLPVEMRVVWAEVEA